MATRPIKIAIMALGGQGGGVLSNWIVAAYERAGFLAQSTSVPGVAQRTGATIYYIEAMAEATARAASRPPVFALSPAKGDVDIVLAPELMEAVRAVDRGFVSADQTALIASTHRVYTITEKSAMGDGAASADAARARAKAAAKSYIAFDMEKAARETGAVISAVMFGALAGSGDTGLARHVFEEVVRADGRMVAANLAGFAQGFGRAARRAQDGEEAAETEGRDAAGIDQITEQKSKLRPGPARSRARIEREFPASARTLVLAGAARAADFQSLEYANFYLDRLKQIRDADAQSGGAARDYLLTEEVARYLALWMCYDDAIRVADLKTREARFARLRKEVAAAPDQIVQVSEYMHPRPQEICDILPAPFGRFLLGFGPAKRGLEFVFGRARRVSTSKLRGFLPLYALAALRPFRPLSLRYREEQSRIEGWLDRIQRTVSTDYMLSVEIARCQRLIKGYGDTHARGWRNFQQIMAAVDGGGGRADAPERLAELRRAALADEEGAVLSRALSRALASGPAPAA